jgi:hypothetical protein
MAKARKKPTPKKLAASDARNLLLDTHLDTLREHRRQMVVMCEALALVALHGHNTNKED